MESDFRASPAKTKEIFEKSQTDFMEHFHPFKGNELRWITSGNPYASKTMFFLHGAPGSWADFSTYLTDSTLLEKCFMIAMDRPGYGHSDYGHATPSIIGQVEAAHEILQQYDRDTLILIGYSYGGPIAASYAARYPTNVENLILLAPVVNPDHEKIFWFNPIIAMPMARWILPKFVTVANEEKLNHEMALKEVARDWKYINIPTVHMHCKDDWIAPFEDNSSWIKSNIADSLLTQIAWTGDNHFLPNKVKSHILPVLYSLLNYTTNL